MRSPEFATVLHWQPPDVHIFHTDPSLPKMVNNIMSLTYKNIFPYSPTFLLDLVYLVVPPQDRQYFRCSKMVGNAEVECCISFETNVCTSYYFYSYMTAFLNIINTNIIQM